MSDFVRDYIKSGCGLLLVLAFGLSGLFFSLLFIFIQ